MLVALVTNMSKGNDELKNFKQRHSFSFRDYGIFITNIILGGIADKNGRLKVGDRLMHVQSLVNKAILLASISIGFSLFIEKLL